MLRALLLAKNAAIKSQSGRRRRIQPTCAGGTETFPGAGSKVAVAVTSGSGRCGGTTVALAGGAKQSNEW
jgi:hypothetical protein